MAKVIHGRQTVRSKLSVSAFALCAASFVTPAFAQESNPAPGPAATESEVLAAQEAGEIVVTATRLQRQNVPTPLVILTPEILQQGGRTNVVAALNEQPQFRATVTPRTNPVAINAGSWTVDLRGLDGGTSNPTSSRTLTLIDGHRIVQRDISIVPSALIERVDVVTGSASAAWGSDAVAGVVNIITNKKLEGVKAGAQFGVTGRGDGSERKFDLAAGTSFAAGRGHIVIGGEYNDDNGIFPRSSRRNTGRWALIANPAFTATNGQKPLIYAYDARTANVSFGGLIRTGVNAGRTFNPDGTLRTFDAGTLVSGVRFGGEGPALDDFSYLAAPSTRLSGMASLTYELSDAITFSGDVLYGRVHNNYPVFPDVVATTFNISVNNAFLPAAIRNQLVAAGETSFTLGRYSTDYAYEQLRYNRETIQANIALNGRLGTFSWRAAYGHGEYRDDYDFRNQQNAANLAKAVNSVIGPAGAPVCAVNADAISTNDDNACQPINLFGVGSPSQAARSYILGAATSRSTYKLDYGALTLQGEAFQLPAGAVSIAAGAEIRRQSLETVADAVSQANGWTFFNPKNLPFSAITTKEAFVEVQVPIVRDVPLLERLEFNGAARVAHDPTGSIWAWKLGLINKVASGIEVRFTTSRDIRAPSVSELYSPQLVSLPTVNDPLAVTPQPASYQVRQIAGGNPGLQPEVSRTTTIGGTLTPGFLPGLRISADYYDINIKNAISSLTAQQTIDLCQLGIASACGAIVRQNGAISSITTGGLNFVNFRASGIDGAINLNVPLSPADSLNFRSSFSWVHRFEQNNGFTTVDYLRSQQSTANIVGSAAFVANSSITYDSTNFSGNIRARYVSPGEHDKTRQIENNHIPAYWYFDAGVRFKVSPRTASGFEFYANVLNIFDKDPPISSSSSAYYDNVGRSFSAGVRVSF